MFFIVLSVSRRGYGDVAIGDVNPSLGAVLITQCTIKPNTLSRCLYSPLYRWYTDRSIYIYIYI